MSGDTLGTITRVLEIALTALVGFAGSYFVLRGRNRDAEAQEKIARIQNEDELMTAVKGLQTTYADTYRQLLADVSEPLEKLRAESSLLRAELKKANDEIAAMHQEIGELRRELDSKERRIAKLEVELDKERERSLSLRARLENIKKEIDTGPFKSGPHKIPKDDKS